MMSKKRRDALMKKLKRRQRVIEEANRRAFLNRVKKNCDRAILDLDDLAC